MIEGFQLEAFTKWRRRIRSRRSSCCLVQFSTAAGIADQFNHAGGPPFCPHGTVAVIGGHPTDRCIYVHSYGERLRGISERKHHHDL